MSPVRRRILVWVLHLLAVLLMLGGLILNVTDVVLLHLFGYAMGLLGACWFLHPLIARWERGVARLRSPPEPSPEGPRRQLG